MKNYKYIALFLLSLGVISCDVNNVKLKMNDVQDMLVNEL